MSELQPGKISSEKTPTRNRGQSAKDVEPSGIYRGADSSEYLRKYVVPVLAETFNAPRRDARGLIGKVGTVERSAEERLDSSNRTKYEVYAERLIERDKRDKKVGIFVLQITITEFHTLDEFELITEWPVLEDLGAGDDLLVDAVSYHTHVGGEQDADLDDPELQREMAAGQLDSLSELDEEDEETMAAVVYGQDVQRYYEKEIRLVSGRKPTLVIRAGYETDSATYKIDISDAFVQELTGQNPLEVALLSQLRQESFTVAEDSVMHGFEDALIAVGMMSRHAAKGVK